jgi:hypothetical protein
MNHATRLPRLISIFTALTLLAPVRVLAAPAEEPQALAVFEAGFKDGQAQFDGGEFRAAARTWIAAAANLSEKLSNRDNRLAVYEYVVDAFTSGLQGVEQPEALREAVEALDAYCEGFTRAYGTETSISAKITGARDDFKARLAKAEAAQAAAGNEPAEGPVELPPVVEPPPPDDNRGQSKSWKGLAITGGVLTGLGVGAGAFAAVYGAKGKSQEDEYLEAGCRMMTTVDCQDLRASGEASNKTAVRAALSAVPLLAVGVTLLAIGLKRRSRSRTAFTPTLAPGFAGLGVRGSF